MQAPPSANKSTPRVVRIRPKEQPGPAAELAAGLCAHPAQVSPKYLYDALGARLFDAITELPEYYPTRTEGAIFALHAEEIARATGAGRTLVDLGAGSCAKAARLFATLRPRRYVAVDISAEYLRQSLASLQREHSQIEMVGVELDFSTALELPAEAGDGPRTVFFAGSSIGNFMPAQAGLFLRQARQAAQGGTLLIGVDLVKPAQVLEPAYDDALGVTAAFNLNLLLHVNALLGSDFDVRDWQHVARYDGDASRIEMHLQARRELTVRWPGGVRRFAAGERMHTENSYKYRRADFEALLRDAGFAQVRCWTDERGWFAVFAAA